MILVGQYDSPFVRRVAVTLNLYGLPFGRRPSSVFKDFDAVLALNPLGKVPVLALDDGENLFDSRAILDYLDGLVEPERRLLPAAEPERRCCAAIKVRTVLPHPDCRAIAARASRPAPAPVRRTLAGEGVSLARLMSMVVVMVLMVFTMAFLLAAKRFGIW